MIAGPRYLCDAELRDGPDRAAGNELDARAGRIAREQQLDVFRLRMFRQAVLVRDDSRATAGGSTRAPIAELHARSSLRPPRRLRPEARAVDEFRAPGGGSLRIDHPLVKGERWSSWPTRGRTRCGTASSPRKPQSGSPARATTRRFWPRCWSPIAATRSSCTR